MKDNGVSSLWKCRQIGLILPYYHLLGTEIPISILKGFKAREQQD